MKYIVIDNRDDNFYTTEHATKKDALKIALSQFNNLTANEKKKCSAFYVLKSVNPNKKSENHFDGVIIKQFI